MSFCFCFLPFFVVFYAFFAFFYPFFYCFYFAVPKNNNGKMEELGGGLGEALPRETPTRWKEMETGEMESHAKSCLDIELERITCNKFAFISLACWG